MAATAVCGLRLAGIGRLPSRSSASALRRAGDQAGIDAASGRFFQYFFGISARMARFHPRRVEDARVIAAPALLERILVRGIVARRAGGPKVRPRRPNGASRRASGSTSAWR